MTPINLVVFGASTSAPREGVVVFSTLLERDLPARGVPVRVFNSGVPGNTSEAARGRFERDVLAHQPDVVTLQLGLNDAAINTWDGKTQPRVPVERYRENMLFFLAELRARNARPIILLPQPIQWTDVTRSRYTPPIYNHDDPDGWINAGRGHHDELRRIAHEERVPIVDLAPLFRKHVATHGGTLYDLFTDGMHPNSDGHRLIADALIGPVIEAARAS